MSLPDNTYSPISQFSPDDTCTHMSIMEAGNATLCKYCFIGKQNR
jgi:hypothetical protein